MITSIPGRKASVHEKGRGGAVKRLFLITMLLATIFSLVSCAQVPAEQSTVPPQTDATYSPIPEELPAEGLCVVGIVDAKSKMAKILTEDGLVFEVPYSSSSYLLPGEVYRFTRMNDVVKLAQLQLTGSYGNPWCPRMIDNAELEKPDCVYVNDGRRGYIYELTEDCVVFIRYSNTEYRILKGSDIITVSDWPCWAHFNTISAPAEELVEGSDFAGYTSVMMVVGDPQQEKLHADMSTSCFFDPEGLGWLNGDLIIE